MAMTYDPKARVTGEDHSLRTPSLIDVTFTSLSEAEGFYKLLRDSEDDYRNVCLWRNDGWKLVDVDE